MATLHVRNVPDALYERLRERARSSRRSINSEAIEVLRSGLSAGASLSPGEFLERVREGRPKIEDGAPTAVQLIRADRER